MSGTTRRSFLAQAAASAAAVSLARTSRAAGANERITVGLIGCGGRSASLWAGFAPQSDVELAWVCDPDDSRAGKLQTSLGGRSPKTTRDLRQVLDDKSVDAVIIATPDHWHTPAALLALAAGKHVYVEKPISHNVHEGRLLVDAQKKSGRVVQVGTQARSTPHVQKAIEMVRGGAIGKVLITKAWDSQRRGNIGHAKPGNPPAGVDYDMWVGPAPMVPFQANRFHYNWHWSTHFGTGDMGNDGVHQLDVACWALGVETHPSSVASAGGKFFFDDDQEFADTQYTVFNYPGDGKFGSDRKLIFEMRLWSPYPQEEMPNGNVFYGTEGMLLVSGYYGWKLIGKGTKVKEEFKATDVDMPAHARNFLDSIKGKAKPNAPVEAGHRAATLAHLGNIATRLGTSLKFDPAKEQIVGNPDAAKLVSRTYREGHWAAPKG